MKKRLGSLSVVFAVALLALVGLLLSGEAKADPVLQQATPSPSPTPNATQKLEAPPMVRREEWCDYDDTDPERDPSWTLEDETRCIDPYQYIIKPISVSHLVVHHEASRMEELYQDPITTMHWLWKCQRVQYDEDCNLDGSGAPKGDVPYNYVIDPDGVIYQGRYNPDLYGEDTKGAHAYPFNDVSVGVALMGNFNSQIKVEDEWVPNPDPYPSEQALASLKQVLAWKASQYGIDPLETAEIKAQADGRWFEVYGQAPVHCTADTIAAHRAVKIVEEECNLGKCICQKPDWAHGDCPGDNLYVRMDEIRQDVARLLRPPAPTVVSPRQGEELILPPYIKFEATDIPGFLVQYQVQVCPGYYLSSIVPPVFVPYADACKIQPWRSYLDLPPRLKHLLSNEFLTPDLFSGPGLYGLRVQIRYVRNGWFSAAGDWSVDRVGIHYSPLSTSSDDSTDNSSIYEPAVLLSAPSNQAMYHSTGYVLETSAAAADNTTAYRTFVIPGPVANTTYRPGNDHSDDNYSAASAQPADYSLPAGARQEYRVGVLQNGFAENAIAFLKQAGEPAWPVNVDFDPVVMAEQLPVLVVPSGGLYGMEADAAFRTRLEEYARLGGAIVAFGQQHGYEFGALPGGELGGYGWTEDSSCFAASLYLSHWHQILSGFSGATLDVHVDGYFATLPSDAQVLLSRNKNAQPSAILYPFGEGWVLATTIYDDWGTLNGQSSPHARKLVGDLLSWAIPDTFAGRAGQPEPAALPQFDPGDPISLTIPLDPQACSGAHLLRVSLISPDRQVVETRHVPLETCNSAPASCTFTTTAATPLGIWRIDAELLIANGHSLSSQKQAARFVVADPAAAVDPSRPLLIGITAPDDSFVPGTLVPFTFHVFNTGDVTRTATIRYGLPHHSWESGDYATYGEYDLRSHTLSVAPHGEATYTWEVIVFRQDRLFAKLLEEGQEVGRADYGIHHVPPPEAQVLTTVDPPEWVHGRPMTAAFTIVNSYSAAWNGTLLVRLTGTDDTTLYTATIPLEMPVEGQAILNATFAVPPDYTGRGAYLSAIAYDNLGNQAGESLTYLPAARSPVSLSATIPSPLLPGATQSITIVVTNASTDVAVTDGNLAVTLTDPQDVVLPLGSQPYALDPGQAVTLSFPLAPPQPVAGKYYFTVAAADEHGTYSRYWRADSAYAVSGYPSHPSYRAGGTLYLSTLLYNHGSFQESLQISVQVPDAAYSDTQTVTVVRGHPAHSSFATTLPADIAEGTHYFTVTAVQPTGSTRMSVSRFVVAPPELQVSAQPAAEAGGVAELVITNIGGVSANAEYGVALYDWEGTALQATGAFLSDLGVDEVETIPLSVPADARSGDYWLRGFVRETQTDAHQDFALPIEIAGLQAGLTVAPEQLFYVEGQPVAIVVTATSTGPAVSGALLNLRATSPVGALMWQTYRSGLSPLPYNYVNDLALDGDLLWIAQAWWEGESGAAVLDYGGTPFDTSDDTWQVFDVADGLSSAEITHMAVDDYSRRWFGTWGHGVNVLDDNGTPFDKSDDRWATFHVHEEPDWDSIWDAAPDQDYFVWLASSIGLVLLDHNETPFYAEDDFWHAFTTADGLSHDEVRTVTIDPMGLKWLGTYGGGLNVLDDGGTPSDPVDDQWESFGPEDGLPSLTVWDIVVDEEWRKWLVTEDGVSVLDDAFTPLDKSDDRWQTFTVADGLHSNLVRTLWIDPLGRKWIGSDGGGLSILDDGGTPFDKSDDTWESYSTYDGLASQNVRSIVGSGTDEPVWVATEDGLQAIAAVQGLEPATLQATVPLDLGAGESRTITVPAGTPGRVGKYRVQAWLSLGPDYVIGEALGAFYVFPDSSSSARLTRPPGLAEFSSQSACPSLALTVDVSPLTAKPGQPITVSGVVRNGGPTPLEPTLTVSQDGQALQAIGPFALAPGAEYPYSIVTAAPLVEGPILLAATAADGSGHLAEVEEVVVVAQPVVVMELLGPGLVGSAPFSASLILNNVGQADAQVTVDGFGPEVGILVPAGHRRIVQRTLQTDAYRQYEIVLSGDVQDSLLYEVFYGEGAAVYFEPQPVYPAGLVEIPYTLLNTGALPVQFTTDVAVADSSSVVSQSSFDTYLPWGEAASEILILELAEGDYTLTYATPFETGEVAFTVLPPTGFELAAETVSIESGTATVSAVVRNTGSEAFDGLLRLETPFFTADQTVSLPPFQDARTFDLPVNLAAASPGEHVGFVSLVSGSGQEMASCEFPLAVGGPVLSISRLPETTPLAAGGVHTLTFGVANDGDLAGAATLHLTLGDFEDEEQIVWVEAGADADVEFVFYLPAGLEYKDYVACYELTGAGATESGDFAIPVHGVNLAVEAAWDKLAYDAGEDATLSITITNLSTATTPDLFVQVQHSCPAASLASCYPLVTPIESIAQLDRVELDSTFPAEQGIVFYGIYEASEERGIHLNTTYLYTRNPDVTVVPDRSVYRLEDTAKATILTTASGFLTVTAPGFNTTIDLVGVDTGFEFVVPADSARGTYYIEYALDGGSVYRAPFDVDAPWVRVLEARLVDPPYVPGDSVRADLTIASSEPVQANLRAWIVAPDGTAGVEMTGVVDLDAILNNHLEIALPLDTAQAGTHHVLYTLVDTTYPDLVYLGGSEAFDVGGVAVLGVRTDLELYPHSTDTVTASLTVHASGPIEAAVELALDGVIVKYTSVQLEAGVQDIALALPGPLAPSWHELTARVESEGLESESQTRFACGLSDADLHAWKVLLSGSGPERTLSAWVYNEGSTDAGSTSVQFWDGAPDDGGTLIGTEPLAALGPGEGAVVEMAWNVEGKVGPHMLVAIADVDDLVAEFNEEDNVAAEEITVPPFELTVSTGSSYFDEGESVVITTSLTNLTGGPLTMAVTTTVESESDETVLSNVSELHASGVQAESVIAWDTAEAANEVYSIRAAAEGGAGSSNTISVQVENVAPLVNAGDDVSVGVGQAAGLSGSFTDPGLLDTHTWVWDFGDGTTGSDALTVTHAYATEGVYTATLTVLDSDGGIGTDALRVTVVPGVHLHGFELERAYLHWWGLRGDLGVFMLRGQFSLPDGYTPDDLTGDLQLSLTIGEGSAFQDVSLAKRGSTWAFYAPPRFPGQEEDLVTTMVFLWQKPGSTVMHFTLHGFLSIDGVNRKTRPAEVTVGLKLGVVDENDGGCSMSGEERIALFALRYLWSYRKPVWWFH